MSGAGLHWSRVADRKLRLSDEIQIVRQMHRGVLWYVVRDALGDRYYRFNPASYIFLSLLDGTRTVGEAHRIVESRLRDDAPSQVEIIRLLWRLHTADMLRGDMVGRTDAAVDRARQAERKRLWMQLRSPLALRVPLINPAPFMGGLKWLARVLFSWPAFALWCVLVGFALLEVGLNWQALSANFSDRVLSADNLILMWFVFPVVKLMHEMGHALALRRWDCESHEMGIMFLVFMPVPYIDASSSAVMTRASQRAIVGAAGLYFELAIAAVATLLWVELEPGLTRAVAFNIMIIAGASAVLFNGNPLLKFDAYYVLSDVLEIPNLAQRSGRWWLNMIQSRLFGLEPQVDAVEAQGETPWLMTYAPASFAYRLTLVFAIALFVAKQFFFLGTTLAMLAVYNILLQPIVNAAKFLARTPRLSGRRTRALGFTIAIVGGLCTALTLIPVPHRSVAQGVVWYSEGAELVPSASGSVLSFAVMDDAAVSKGELIATLSDPETQAEIDRLSARLRALQAQYRSELTRERDRARLTQEEIGYTRARIEVAEERQQALRFLAPMSGRLVVPDMRAINDGWLGRGRPIGHVVGVAPPVILAALPQADMDLLGQGVGGVEIRFATDLGEAVKGTIRRVRPRATDELPADLLAAPAGGPFSLRQTMPGERGLRSVERFVVVEIDVPRTPQAHFGGRAYVRFDFGAEPIAFQLGRTLRRLFLREFAV